jgi:hypothetical protein
VPVVSLLAENPALFLVDETHFALPRSLQQKLLRVMGLSIAYQLETATLT